MVAAAVVSLVGLDPGAGPFFLDPLRLHVSKRSQHTAGQESKLSPPIGIIHLVVTAKFSSVSYLLEFILFVRAEAMRYTTVFFIHWVNYIL